MNYQGSTGELEGLAQTLVERFKRPRHQSHAWLQMLKELGSDPDTILMVVNYLFSLPGDKWKSMETTCRFRAKFEEMLKEAKQNG